MFFDGDTKIVQGFLKYSGGHRSGYGPAGVALAERDVRLAN